MADIPAFWQNYVDGASSDGGACQIDVTDPNAGEGVAGQDLANASDVDLNKKQQRR